MEPTLVKGGDFEPKHEKNPTLKELKVNEEEKVKG